MCGRVFLLLLLPGLLTATDSAEDPTKYMPQVGHSIDVLPRYGYFALSMKVVARNETSQSWIFREPTVDVFSHLAPYTSTHQSPKHVVFDGDFHMEFCDNPRQLLQAYFRDFTFERLSQPWRAFTGSWSPETVAKHMGINASFVHGEYCYVLVRLSRVREKVTLERLPGNVELSEMVERDVASVRMGDAASVLNFVRRIGSHYVNKFVTGNSLYQVFVYKKPMYNRIRERLKTRGISQMSNTELSNFFSPWYAEHMGRIKTASGNRTVENWADSKLRVLYYIFSYPSLLKIHGETKLLSALNELLANEALLEIEMKALTPVFKDPAKRAWFEEVLDNFLNLLEQNS